MFNQVSARGMHGVYIQGQHLLMRVYPQGRHVRCHGNVFGCEVELGVRCRPYLGGTLRRGGILPGEMQPIPLKRAATLIFILEVNFLIFFC